MRWLAFRYQKQYRVGVLQGDKVFPFKDYMDLIHALADFDVSELRAWEPDVRGIDLDKVEILPPISTSGRNIFALGMNYKDHIAELGAPTPEKPLYFTKTPPTTAHMATVKIPQMTQQLDYEAELAIIISDQAKNLTPENAMDYVFGYTIANDLSARDVQFERGQYFRGKSFDDCCPLGPYVLLYDGNPNPDFAISCRVNGELRQNSRTSQLLFGLTDILVDLTRDLTLYPGDIILTGTPGGVGMGLKPPKFLKPGDQVVCSIEGIGDLITHFE